MSKEALMEIADRLEVIKMDIEELMMAGEREDNDASGLSDAAGALSDAIAGIYKQIHESHDH